MQIDA
jgi:hypothetical protein